MEVFLVQMTSEIDGYKQCMKAYREKNLNVVKSQEEEIAKTAKEVEELSERNVYLE